MVHLLIIKVNSIEIDGVPVTGTPVGSRTVLQLYVLLLVFKICKGLAN